MEHEYFEQLKEEQTRRPVISRTKTSSIQVVIRNWDIGEQRLRKCTEILATKKVQAATQSTVAAFIQKQPY